MFTIFDEEKQKWVALMPDTHPGFGIPIGGVIATENAIIPNAVGSYSYIVRGKVAKNMFSVVATVKDNLEVL